MPETITISGTDPTNPRCGDHIIARLEQIARDTEAMHVEAGRLMVFAAPLRDVLLDQGVPLAEANRRVEAITGRARQLRGHLFGAQETARETVEDIRDSKVNTRTRFTWRHP